MIKRFAAVALATVLAGGAAQAEKVDMSTITCKQLLEGHKDDIGVLLVWMHGYLGGNNEDTLLDTAEFEQGAKDIAEYCVANPETSLMNAVKEQLGEEE